MEILFLPRMESEMVFNTIFNAMEIGKVLEAELWYNHNEYSVRTIDGDPWKRTMA